MALFAVWNGRAAARSAMPPLCMFTLHAVCVSTLVPFAVPLANSRYVPCRACDRCRGCRYVAISCYRAHVSCGARAGFVAPRVHTLALVRPAAYPGCQTASDCQKNGDKGAYCRENGYWCVALRMHTCSACYHVRAVLICALSGAPLQPLRPAVLQRDQRWYLRGCVLPHLCGQVLPHGQAVPGGYVVAGGTFRVRTRLCPSYVADPPSRCRAVCRRRRGCVLPHGRPGRQRLVPLRHHLQRPVLQLSCVVPG